MADVSARPDVPVTVIRQTHGPIPPRLDELWAFREAFLLLVWRDVKVRYAQTALGAAWMVFQPLAMMLVYTFAFSHLAGISVAGTPYPVFALSGLTLWVFFSRGLLLGSESLVTNITLITKTSCPRILIPLAGVVSVLVDFLVAFLLFLVISALYGVYPTWRFVAIPPLVLVAFLLTVGLSFLLSAVNVRYRDVGQALPFIIQLWFFLSPVAYQLQTLGRTWGTIIQALNPIVGLILAFRWSLLAAPAPKGIFVVAVIIALGSFVVGVIHFARTERTIADDI